MNFITKLNRGNFIFRPQFLKLEIYYWGVEYGNEYKISAQYLQKLCHVGQKTQGHGL